mmetsp:Transcript_37444/g.112274  ORF Transcript_37444/g.112274 Transcript_37444/m.112274 type:complete len:94 (-) Transcript_37444:137-418(-)
MNVALRRRLPPLRTGGKDRYALTITYVDATAEIREDAVRAAVPEGEEGGSDNDDEGPLGDNEDRWSYREWVAGVAPRMAFEHDLAPIVYPPLR